MVSYRRVVITHQDAAVDGGLALPLELTGELAELRDRARRFVDEIVIPREVEAERNGGKLPAETIELIKREAIAARLNGGLHSPEYGGQGWSRLGWALVEEQFGRSTNGIYWHIPNAYNVWDHCSAEQCERYLRPALRGEAKDAYAVTERDAGSDPSRIEATAERSDGGFRLNGEKWFVTSGDVAAVYIVMANVIDGDERLPTLFLVDRDLDGIEVVDDPAFTHTYPEGHPTILFKDVEVPADSVVGGIGEGNEMQRGWFTEERIAIAARGVGAMWRLLDETVAWATEREQGGERIYDYQGVSFPLADSAADAAAGRLLALSVATLADAGADPKVVHHKASMAKLFVSEAAWRCADRCVQAFGGRGYMRDNVAERLLRELRVDRIWEGTSEIQRLIVARGLERRGVERILH
jgi:acyl-CoA dehydrogenase